MLNGQGVFQEIALISCLDSEPLDSAERVASVCVA